MVGEERGGEERGGEERGGEEGGLACVPVRTCQRWPTQTVYVSLSYVHMYVCVYCMYACTSIHTLVSYVYATLISPSPSLSLPSPTHTQTVEWVLVLTPTMSIVSSLMSCSERRLI